MRGQRGLAEEGEGRRAGGEERVCLVGGKRVAPRIGLHACNKRADTAARLPSTP